MSIRSRSAAGDFENRAANSISSGASSVTTPPTAFPAAHHRLPVPDWRTAAHFARLLHGPLTHRISLRSLSLFRLGTHSSLAAPQASQAPRYPSARRIFDKPEVRHPDYFAEEKSAAQGRLSRRHCRRHKEDCRGTIAAASRRGWSRILTGFPTAVILFKVIFRILPSNRKRQREVRTEVRTEACTTRCCAAKSCATKSRVDRRQLFRQIAYIP